MLAKSKPTGVTRAFSLHVKLVGSPYAVANVNFFFILNEHKGKCLRRVKNDGRSEESVR